MWCSHVALQLWRLILDRLGLSLATFRVGFFLKASSIGWGTTWQMAVKLSAEAAAAATVLCS